MEEITKHSFNNPKSKQIARLLTDQVVHGVWNKLLQNSLEIPEQQIPFLIHQKEENDPIDSAKKKLQKIEERKKLIFEQLQDLKKQEEQEGKIVKSSQTPYSYKRKLIKSQLSSVDKENLKKLSKAKKKFEHQLKKKNKKIQEDQKKNKSQREEAYKQQLEKRRQNRKDEAESHIRQISKRQKQREKKIRHQERKLLQLKERKKLYEESIARWNEIQQSEEKRKREEVEERKKLKMVDFNEIKQHEKKYDDMMKEQKESRIQNLSRVQWDEKLYYSPFIDAIKEEEAQNKSIEAEKKKQVKVLVDKKNQYSKLVLEKHRPTIKQKDEIKIQEDNHKSLSFFQAHKKGVQYLRIMNENAKNHPKQKKQTPEKSFKYENYLPDIRRNKGETNLSEIEKINEVLKSSAGVEQKFLQSKILAQKIDNKVGKQSDKSLMKSINAKLRILKEIEE